MSTNHEEQETRIRVLFVEDDEDLRELVTDFLASQGYDVTDVGSAEDGLSQLQAARFDVVLSDNTLPGHTGTWMLTQARSAGLLQETAAVMMSGDDRGELFPGVPVVRKPAGTQQLLDVLASVVVHDDGGGDDDAGLIMQLDLYVDGGAAGTPEVVGRLERAIAALSAAQAPQNGGPRVRRPRMPIRMSVIDVRERALSGPVTATPTLVCRVAGRTVRVVDELEDTAGLEVQLLKARTPIAR